MPLQAGQNYLLFRPSWNRTTVSSAWFANAIWRFRYKFARTYGPRGVMPKCNMQWANKSLWIHSLTRLSDCGLLHWWRIFMKASQYQPCHLVIVITLHFPSNVPFGAIIPPVSAKIFSLKWKKQKDPLSLKIDVDIFFDVLHTALHFSLGLMTLSPCLIARALHNPR